MLTKRFLVVLGMDGGWELLQPERHGNRVSTCIGDGMGFLSKNSDTESFALWGRHTCDDV